MPKKKVLPKKITKWKKEEVVLCWRCNKPKWDDDWCCNCGRPPTYNTVESLQAKIDEYFAWWHRKRKVWRKVWKDEYEEVEVSAITITDLVIFLWFADRRSFYDLEEKEKFAYTIKRARSFIEREYEELLQINPTWAIFALKNFGWIDKQTLEHDIQTDTSKTIDKMKALWMVPNEWHESSKGKSDH